MNKEKFLYVANWKMKMPFSQALAFCTNNKNQLINLTQNFTTQIIICPEYPALYPISQILQNSESIYVGAQNCSRFKTGAYTGEVSARTLKEAGCTYCIVGHSERRLLFKENNECIAQKTIRVLEQNIQPIVCFGETKEEHNAHQTKNIIEQQLTPVAKALINNDMDDNANLCLAYEPIWSIGTGLVAKPDYLQNIFLWVKNWINEQLPNVQITLLYGGSVNEDNAKQLKEIPEIDGFLIGGASLDFQKLQKIVL